MPSPYVPPTPVATAPVSPPTPPIVAGMEPSVFEAILYGKDIPLFIGGKMLIGGRICEGPFFGGTQEDPTVSFVAYHAHNIGTDDYGDTVITQARLRGQEVWNDSAGYISTDKLPSGSFDWRPGHNAQSALTQSVARYGTQAVAYTEGITSSWTDVPLKPFGGIIPFPSVLVENSRYGDPDDGIPRSEAISRVFDYMRLSENEYEVDVSGSDPAWMVGSQITMEEFLRQLRAVFVNYQIIYDNKLRIIEPADGFSVSSELTNSNVLRGTLKFKRTDPMLLPREKRYTYIDVDRDYEMNVAVASEDRFPVPTTDAVSTTSVELPIATTAAQAVADIHISLYEELSVRSQMEGVANSTLFGMQCGDGTRFADSPIIDMSARVLETVHDFENFTVQFVAGEVLRCDATIPETDPDFGDVVLLLHADGAAGSTSFVDSSSFANTVTASGGAQVSSGAKFGTGALVCDGSGDYLSTNIATLGVSGTALSATNTSPYTIECWAKFTAVNRVQYLVMIDTGLNGRFFRLWQDGDDELKFRWEDTGGIWDPANEIVTSGLNIATDVWYHIAADKDSTGKVRLYVDGVMVASDTPANSVIGPTGDPVQVGWNFLGLIDDVRISRMISRYGDVGGDASFTPPTQAFPNS